jgi:hypothetical protein
MPGSTSPDGTSLFVVVANSKQRQHPMPFLSPKQFWQKQYQPDLSTAALNFPSPPSALAAAHRRAFAALTSTGDCIGIVDA